MPFVEKEHYEISRKSRLHPDNDLYRDQEQHKIHVDVNEWQCGYCRKRFYTEKHLDQHFDNRHYELLNVVCDAIILIAICFFRAAVFFLIRCVKFSLLAKQNSLDYHKHGLSIVLT